jgi:hypothetical protein
LLLGPGAPSPELLAYIAPYIPHSSPHVMRDAVVLALSISDFNIRAFSTETLFLHFPAAARADVARTALLDIESTSRPDAVRAGAIAALAPFVPTSLVDRAMQIASSIGEEGQRAIAIAAVAARLEEPQRSDALRAAMSLITGMPKNQRRGQALRDIAAYLPPAMLPRAVAAAREIVHLEERATTLTVLAPKLSREEKYEVIAEVLVLASTLHEERRAHVLMALAPWLPTKMQVSKLRRAFELAWRVVQGKEEIELLQKIPYRLPNIIAGETRSEIDAKFAYMPLPEIESFKRMQRAEWVRDPLPRVRLLEETPPAQRDQIIVEVVAALREAMGTGPAESLGVEPVPAINIGPISGARPREAEMADGPAEMADELIVDTRPERVVNTGFASEEKPAEPITPETPLGCAQSYYFWLEVGPLVAGAIDERPTPLPVELLPPEALLKVALFGFEGELEIDSGADVGEIRILRDGSVRVERQPSDGHAPAVGEEMLRRRLFFPVRTPDRADTFKLRCNIYYEQVLVQSRLVRARVMRKPRRRSGAQALTTRLDYTLSRRLQPPTESAAPEPHRLSLMLNDNGNGTHGFRFFGQSELKTSATFDGHELQDYIQQIRGALRLATWNTDTEWDGKLPNRYDAPFDLSRLKGDLVRLAIRGYRVYDAIINRLAGGSQKVNALADLMRTPGLVQIALKESARFVIPSAVIYDYPLDTDLGADCYQLCPDFLAALQRKEQLEKLDCFAGDCPSRDEDDVVCPSGFWGYRHYIGMPLSVQEGLDAPGEIPYSQPLQATVAISTDPNFTVREGHLLRMKALGPTLEIARTRDETFAKFTTTKPQIVYFYCHGGFDAQKNVPYLLVGALNERPITRANLRSKRVVWSNPRPLVFINGCHTTSLEPEVALDFVSAFVENSDAAGVIGTEITIFESLASAFAEEWLRRMLAGDNLGQAIRGTRLKLLEAGNPLGLVYIPYALASLHLQEQ